jgi:endonuclease III
MSVEAGMIPTTLSKPALSERKARARKTLAILRQTFPDAACSLVFHNALELLIATILSAQCTDKTVNALTPRLFSKYPDVAAWASAPIAQIEVDIKSAGFFHNKAKSILGCCQALLANFGGVVPDKMEDLITLPGVGRKTANVILAAVWNQPAIIVDTHVSRLATRLGLTTEKDPDKIEFDLQALLPNKDWSFFSHALIQHGRNICTAKRPNCATCKMNKFCPSAFKVA